jgi:hypothetical protein
VHERRWVCAPGDSDPSAANRILGVWLAPGERIMWEWATRDHGRPYVSGYTIESARIAASRERRPCGFRVDP